MSSFRVLAGGIAVAAAILLHGCYTEPPPVPAPRSMSERFDASWQAARGAMSDVGARVTREDRTSGTLNGTRGSSDISITVVPQADQTIQVGFAVTGGAAASDASLKDQVTNAYQRRMGR